MRCVSCIVLAMFLLLCGMPFSTLAGETNGTEKSQAVTNKGSGATAQDKAAGPVPQKRPEQWPNTLEDAVDKIVKGLTEADKETLRNTAREGLITYHHGWGTGIRNSFGLWRGNEELIRSACGGELCHPDSASMAIIEKVWEAIQKDGPQKSGKTGKQP